MNRILMIFGLFAAAAFAGCKKSNSSSAPAAAVTHTSQIRPPAGFLWQSSHNVAFTVQITDTRFGSAIHAISIYDGNPYNGGHLIAKGSATTATPYTNTLYLPTAMSEVYVMKTAPDNSQIISTAAVSGSSVSLSFGDFDPTVLQRDEHRNSGERTTVDCSSGCTTTITSNTSGVNVNTGNVICITGSNITVNFSSINGGTIRVCGSNVTLMNVNLNGSATLWITSTGSATASSLNFNSSSATVENDGSLSGSFAVGGIFINTGSYTSTSDLNLNSGASFTNSGTMTINGNFNNGASAASSNSGNMTVTGSFQQNSGAGTFTNNCSLLAENNYTQSSTVKNYGFIKVSGTLTLNSGAQLNLYNTAMVETNNFMLNSTITGYGATSLLKITGSVTLNAGCSVTGAVQVSSVNTFNTAYLSGGAALGSSLYVPVTSCNSDGNGAPMITDTDGDGVPDSLDAYPTDPTKAYNNYYPSSSTSGTVAFEDNWPKMGDYDLNDVVVSYRYNIVTNAANNVAEVIGNYTLLATGGTNADGFAVEFPVAAGNVSAVTGGTLQTGQTDAVITLFSDSRNEMSQWNTIPGLPTSPVVTFTVTFTVSSGPAIGTFGLNSYNPYIWNGTGSEVHLPGHLPTSTANAALFGTGDDNTNPTLGVYYLTTSGLPFALDIPISPFKYPVEDTDIVKAYLHFSSWATSGGTSFTDWYSNTVSGYRDTMNLYPN